MIDLPDGGRITTGSHASREQVVAVQRVTLWGLVVNLALCGVKFLFGLVGASQALVADAVHSLSDTVTDVTVLFAAPLWSLPPDVDHPHGHGRIETVVTFLVGLVLAGVGCGLCYRAIVTLHEQHAASPGWIAFVAACLSIVVKELLYRWNVRVGGRVKSSALIANAWHHRSDALSSVPVAVAVLGTRIMPTWGFLDHLATVIVSILILRAAWEISWPALGHLIDEGAAKQDRERILDLVRQTDGVRSVHALRTRNIGPGLQVDLHIEVDEDLSVREGHDIARTVKRCLIEQGPEIVDVLVHVEPSNPQNMSTTT